MANIAIGNARHSIENPGPEPTNYDKARHEKMRLRGNRYGIPKFFVDGLKPQKPICSVCDRLMCWCKCNAKNL